MAALTGGGSHLAVVRVGQPGFEKTLSETVLSVLRRRPDASFDVVAIVPTIGDAAQVGPTAEVARRDAERVLRLLTDMGVPQDRVRLLASTSPEVDVSEVHVYLR